MRRLHAGALVLAMSLLTSACLSSSGSPPPEQKAGSAPLAAGSDGSACKTAGDCTSGICEGQGCGEELGVCVAANRVCSTDARTYCGCDGITFQASGSCPGRRYAALDACPAR